MKKFISMVMAAAMVVSLVPATAFAANAASFKVVDAQEYTEDAADKTAVIEDAELQIKVTDVDTIYAEANDGKLDEFEITLDFEGAEFSEKIAEGALVGVHAKGNVDVTVKEEVDAEDDSITLVLTETKDLEEDDIIVLSLEAFKLVLTKDNAGHEATVTVSGDFGDSDALVFASVLEEGVSVTLKDTADVAVEETTTLKKDLKIEADVDKFYEDMVIELKLSKGFEWDLTGDQKAALVATTGIKTAAVDKDDNDVLVLTVDGTPAKITIKAKDLGIEAVDAKVGDVAKITVKVKEGDSTSAKAWKATAEAVDAAVVVGDVVTISVDEDEDVPEIYSGVNVDNYGITDDSDHKSLKVTFEESVAEAFDSKKAFNITLTEGVYVTDVVVESEELGGLATDDDAVEAAFKAAYEKGEYETFDFKRKAFADTEKPFEFDVTFELIAVPGFVGDVVLTLDGAAFEEAQEVTIATFVAPYTVEAQANDVIIDYRNTEVPTDIVIKEAEAGLWAKDEMTFNFGLDKDIEFEGDPEVTVNEDDSDMELKNVDGMSFTVKTESDEEAAVVTISDIKLYMQRNIPAGAYDLEMGTSAGTAMMTGCEDDTESSALFTEEEGNGDDGLYYVADVADWDTTTSDKYNGFVPEKATVKEGFVNVITAGRDADDASFTTKVVVPVGESYIVAGEQTVALDVPAYVSAAGYTMLPVRAVAVALGIHNNNVLWDQTTKTVTILYGQRIITMTVGAKVINVNGSAIPASASPEVVDGRTFLPMRDLATALGVTDITWDAATKTATLNGNK